MPLPGKVLVDSDVFISYLTRDKLFEHSLKVIEEIASGMVEAYVSSEIYDDIISMLHNNGISLRDVIAFIDAVSKIPHEPLPVNPEIAMLAMKYYAGHGGTRRLHYFDSYHVATAKYYDLPFLTSDRYIIRNAGELGVEVTDLQSIK